MNQFDSYVLLIAVLSAAYILAEFLNYIIRCNDNFKMKQLLKARKKDEIYKRKCIKLHNNIFNHFMSEIYYTPEITANALADMHIKRLQKNGEIDKMYHLMKQQQAI